MGRTEVRSQEVLPGWVRREVRHELGLDADGGDDESRHCERQQLHRVQRAAQEATPEEGRKLKEGAEELVRVVKIQAAQQLHPKDMERRLRKEQI